MPFFPTTYFPRHHLAQSLGAACIARLWLGFAWLMLLSLCRSASLGFAWLGSLGFTQLSFARLASLGSLGLRRFAQPRILARCSHHWLPSLSLRRLASALARVARLASRAKRHSASLDLRRWLARVVPGLLRSRRWLSCWRLLQLSSLGTLLGLASLRLASRRWLALLACCSHRWLPSLGLCQRQLISHRLARVALLMFFSVRLTNSTICNL